MRQLIAALLLVTALGCGSSSTNSNPLPPPAVSTDTATGSNPLPPPVPIFTPEQKAQIIQQIQSIGADAVDVGLAQWSKSNNALATTVAQAITANAETVVLPILNGQSVPPSTEIQDLVATGLTNKLPALAKLSIDGASIVLNTFFTIPGVQESDKVDFIRAFIVAIDNGAKAYLAAPPAIGKTMKSTLQRFIAAPEATDNKK